MSKKLGLVDAVAAKTIINETGYGGFDLPYRGRSYQDESGWECWGYAPPPGWTTRGWMRAQDRFRAIAADYTHGYMTLPFAGMVVKSKTGIKVFRTYTS